MDILPVEGRNELFHDYWMFELDAIMQSIQASVDQGLLSIDDLKARQVKLHKNYLSILSNFPEKTPLNAEIVNTRIMSLIH